MTTLRQAMNATARTNNGALTNISSLNKNLDFFFLAGASRGKDITSTFAGALGEDKELAGRVALWMRDVRGGAGERKQFRNFFNYVVETDNVRALRLLRKMPELGRWDDVLEAFGTPLESDACLMISDALKADDGLCAKWMPRKGLKANRLRKFLELSPKGYRKLIVGLSKTVEQAMCANKWSEINYSHVPSVAAARYQKAFSKHDPEGYTEYRNKLTSGDKSVKINASAVYPHDVVKSVSNGDAKVAQAQWDSLPNYMEGVDERILPVVDVSGSMGYFARGYGAGGTTQPLDIALALGLYVSERNEGVFKDQFITFSATPELLQVKGSLKDRLTQMARSKWDMNTDLEAVFKLILQQAQKFDVEYNEMPTKILILSDMEFDICCEGSSDTTLFNNIKKQYEKSGYKMPQIVFWNLNGREGNSQVIIHDTGSALVSGFSPAIMTSVLGENITPEGVMLDTVMKDKYNY